MDEKIVEKVSGLVAEYAGRMRPEPFPPKTHAEWRTLRDAGTELWLDTCDIEAIEALWTGEFSGLTTNNTLLNREVQKGVFDELLDGVGTGLRDSLSGRELVVETAFVLNAVQALRLVARFDCRVSVELHTDVADDVERTLAYARRYAAVSPDYFIIKVPLTPAGLIATRRLGEEGIPVNFTLGFGARQNFLAAVLARPAYCNVFLGRLNSFVAENELGPGTNVGERATLASQRTVREANEAIEGSTKQIAASMRNGPQAVALAGVDVFTMPPKVAHEYLELEEARAGVSDRTEADMPVEYASGVEEQAVTLDTLYEVPEQFKSAALELKDADPAALTPESLCAHFADRGMPGMLVQWSDADRRAAAEDGKIPKLERWRERFERRELGLDAVMNLSGLMSFATDQAAMDDHIAEILGVSS